MARRIVFRKNDLHAKKMVLVISAGKPRHDRKTLASAVKLRKNGVKVFELCVGGHQRSSKDKAIASKPLRTHRLHVDDYKTLVEVVGQMKGKGNED